MNPEEKEKNKAKKKKQNKNPTEMLDLRKKI